MIIHTLKTPDKLRLTALFSLAIFSICLVPATALAQDSAQAEDAPAQPADDATAQDSAIDVAEEEEDWEALLEQEEAKDGEPAKKGDDKKLKIRAIEIRATPEELSRMGGSAQNVDEARLEQYEYDDPHSILQQVNGVYMRQEDGFGLRPNIGIRGANSERSKKVTLTEDGVLFGPAPYAAPAAYYFPLMTRMVGVEIYKGPGAITYGPQTIGGAINFIGRPVPLLSSEGQLDMAIGAFPGVGRLPTGKLHGYYGFGKKYGGAMLEVVQLGNNGFKELDGGGDTGFNKTEAVLRARLHTDLTHATLHALDLKLGYSQEVSNETYTGLSDADFRDTPNRRYAATQRDQMDWSRYQLQLSYIFELGESFNVTTTAYNHTFDRTWARVGGFADGSRLEDVLKDPTSPRNRLPYDLLTGKESTTDATEALNYISNQRAFLSQGVQTRAIHKLTGQSWNNKLEAGARLHRDYIDRLHTSQLYAMRQGKLEVFDANSPAAVTTDNKGEAVAFAVYAQDTFYYKGLTVSPGMRMEHISTSLIDRQANTQIDNSDTILIPGIGAHYAINDKLGFLAGVHRGFSPVTPGQDDAVTPETSINYEAGARLVDPSHDTHLELVGFFNDYQNLIGECTFASGCDEQDLDNQFNAGQVYVYGAEAMAKHTFALTESLKLPVRAAYTLTLSEFQSAFSSENPQFDNVQAGDELPYVPHHQASLSAGLSGLNWSFDATFNFASAMRERAGQGDTTPEERTDTYAMLDLAAQYRFAKSWQAYTRIDNVTNAQPLAARLPQGARPSRPMLAQIGLKIDL